MRTDAPLERVNVKGWVRESMPWIPDAFIDELLSRTNLEDVVAEYVPLKQKGNRFWGCCPFHNEKTPSFTVNAEGQFYHCFGCGVSGNVFRFVQEMEHMEFPEAVRHLAERAHMEVPEEPGRRGGQGPQSNAQERDRICEANVNAARFFHATLWTPEGAEVLNYLYKRGLSDTDIRRFGLGAAPRDGESLIRHLREKGFEDALLRKAGLAVDRDGRIRDMFRGRAIFPIINPNGKVIGFGGRAMGDAQPKYLNTPDTPVFNKRKGLYALNFARKERETGRLVLVEGYMDTVSLRKYGVRGVVATLGTALTEEQARLIKRQAPEVWISYDGDSAGRKAALRALDIFDGQDGLVARVIDYPAGQDPDDFIRANGLEGFEKLPRYDAAEYRMLRAGDDLDLTTQDGMTPYAMRCCEILRKVKDPIVQENHLRRLAQQTGYDREVLLRQIGTVAVKSEPERRSELRPRGARRIPSEDVPVGEQALLTLLARERIPREMVRPEDFSREINRKLAEWLLQGRKVAAFLNLIEDEGERAEITRAVSFPQIPEEREDCLRLAETTLQTLRKDRMDARGAAIEDEFKATDVDHDRRAELYQKLLAIEDAMDEDDSSKGVSHYE